MIAQRLRRDVGHQRNSGAAVCTHRDEQKPQHHHERGELQRRGRGCIAVVKQGQKVHQNDGAAGAEQDERHTLADFRVRPVGERAEKRQQEQRQNIVRRHDDAGIGLVHVERLGQNERHDVVIHLPERTDGQKRQPDEDGSLVVELHTLSPCSSSMILSQTSRMLFRIHVGCTWYFSISDGTPSPDRTKTVSIPALTPQAMSV